ncbi:hypothetical protein TBLA_0H00960 [Henningerozyma blattae CBS 6284]|uniref:Thioredoxin domain-containing protein n=1 Tax=Henningerozyma blattae (strain ATCC 34711 / CBS 6284 / DSM 70876 / NBRC 10599 / NRRL Y-10934 / UCD 77-7) TaxID=1071380 RepID=I2H7N2_HENB6|nr:hypothetical protein TBLA_0H00960 [Tetrapisispora blattae CBS 6284]CCH62384.1 hypothetical protein TBLA_0H00960 [Tetrapisispora blattae CBS 6284]
MASNINRFEGNLAGSNDSTANVSTNSYINSQESRPSNDEDDNGTDSSEDIDELLEDLAKGDSLEYSLYEQKRKEEWANYLKQASENARRKDEGYGKIKIFTKESELMRAISENNIENSQNSRIILNFSMESFSRCKFMDESLDSIAPNYMTTRFFKVNPVVCPFLVERLNIRVLPCLVVYVNGKEKDRIIGFEGLLNPNSSTTESFPIKNLETRLIKNGVLNKPKI